MVRQRVETHLTQKLPRHLIRPLWYRPAGLRAYRRQSRPQSLRAQYSIRRAPAAASCQSLRHHVPGYEPDVAPYRARRVRWRDTLTERLLRVAAAFPSSTHEYLDTARAPSVLPIVP